MAAHRKHFLSGQVFGFLTVIEEAPRKRKTRLHWSCRCVCGKIIHVLSCDLVRGHVKSCGCLSPSGLTKFKDLTGLQVGFLRVVCRVEDYITPKLRKIVQYRCFCVCGNAVLNLAPNLRMGSVKSCGCMKQRMICEKRGYKLKAPIAKKKSYVPANIPMADERDPLGSSLVQKLLGKPH